MFSFIITRGDGVWGAGRACGQAGPTAAWWLGGLALSIGLRFLKAHKDMGSTDRGASVEAARTSGERVVVIPGHFDGLRRVLVLEVVQDCS